MYYTSGCGCGPSGDLSKTSQWWADNGGLGWQEPPADYIPTDYFADFTTMPSAGWTMPVDYTSGDMCGYSDDYLNVSKRGKSHSAPLQGGWYGGAARSPYYRAEGYCATDNCQPYALNSMPYNTCCSGYCGPDYPYNMGY